MYRETGAGWTLLGVAWSTGLGYGAATLFYQTATFTAHPASSLVWIAVVLAAFGAAIYALYVAGRKDKNAATKWQLRMG